MNSSIPNPDALPRPREDLLKFSGLAEFLAFLDLACGLASTPDRLAALSYGLCQRLADNGTGYADVIVNPTHSAGLCISLLRTQSADAAAGRPARI